MLITNQLHIERARQIFSKEETHNERERGHGERQEGGRKREEKN